MLCGVCMMEFHAIIARYGFARAHAVGRFVSLPYAIPYIVGLVAIVYDLVKTWVAVGKFFFKIVVAHIA